MKFLFFFLVIFLVGCSQTVVDEPAMEEKEGTDMTLAEKMMAENKFADPDEVQVADVEIDIWRLMPYNYVGQLEDVTGGSAQGGVSALYDGEKYVLFGEFPVLPELEEGFFYEGWVVRKGLKFSVISTGKLTTLSDADGLFNIYSSKKDLTDHDFYVLTVEPDDGDPAPAEHILEGTLKQIG